MSDGLPPCATHVAFADETLYNTGRYRGVAVVSMPAAEQSSAELEIGLLLADSQVKEFKWSKLRTAKYRLAAEKLVEWVIHRARQGQLRVDVLVWDIDDSRHAIRGRDDIANMQRMYFHLFRNVLTSRWPDSATWTLLPDEHTAMRWNRLKVFLDLRGSETVIEQNLFTGTSPAIDDKTRFNILSIIECQSHITPLVQVADLFAGLAAFSRLSWDEYQCWYTSNSGQLSLFDCDETDSLTSSERQRCELLNRFDNLCKHWKLGVSLRTNHGLRTMDPANPLNFWWYLPQHEGDLAPVKSDAASS